MIATDDAIARAILDLRVARAILDLRVARAILDLTTARGPDKSICSSEVARALSPEWRPMMAAVRRVATELVRADRIDILRHGKPIDPAGLRGVIRLRIRS